MDAVFIDSNGNRKNFLYQYDKGQTFIVENFEYNKAPKVQFSIKSIKTSPSVGSQIVGSDLRVSIPDELLIYGENIIAYLYIEDVLVGNTIETVFISVIPRKRPADYIYTEEMFARLINGSIMADNCGIADVATWSDGNTGNENRSGYFVSISYDTYNKTLIASKATSLNDVYGVAVDEVGFATNCNEDKLDRGGTLLPKYAYVCTSGFAKVIDNGKCTVGGTCKPNSSGIATPSDGTIGYKVVYRIDSKHVLIFVDQSMHTINNMLDYTNDINDDLIAHKNNTSNPHTVTKSQVGLGNADNTSDINKPVSTAQATAISNAKTEVQNNLNAHTSNTTNPHKVTASQVGAYTKAETDTKIANLVNSAPTTLDTLKELATALGNDPNFATTTATELGKKATTEALNTHTSKKDNPHSVTKAQVGLGNCDNTSDANKPISTATQNALNQINSDLNVLENKIDSLISSSGIVITDSVTNKQYTLGMQDGKLVVIPIDDNTTTE